MDAQEPARGYNDHSTPTAATTTTLSLSPTRSSSSTNARARQAAMDDWSQRCSVEERDFHTHATRLEQQLRAALQSTAHVSGNGDSQSDQNQKPHAFRTAICFDVLTQVAVKYDRFYGLMQVLQCEMARAVYVNPLPAAPTVEQDPQRDEAQRVLHFFSQRTYFTQLEHVLSKKAHFQSQLDALDASHTLMATQLRNEERMVDKIACRWARIVLKQTLVDWKKIIVRKKYTRVLLEKTSRRWSKQRLQRVFRSWTQFAKASRVTRARELVHHCSDQIRDFEELLARMETQIESAKAETRAHREHYDFARRQILSLEELLKQLELRVAASNERKLQTIVNAWGALCLAFVDTQLAFLQNMVDALPLREYVDVTLLLHKGEELSELLRVPADALVLRWINFHVSKTSLAKFVTGQQNQDQNQNHQNHQNQNQNQQQQTGGVGFIKNFGSDMKNNYVLRHILKRVLDWETPEQEHEQTEQKPPHLHQGEKTRSEKRPGGTKLKTTDATGTTSTPSTTSSTSHHAAAPFPFKHELQTALEELLDPPCPPFLSVQVLEHSMASDLAFALFSFLVCEHPTLLATSAAHPWKEAQIALSDARAVWTTVRAQWTELHTPFAVREVVAAPPDLTSPPHLLVRGNIALQNAVNMVQYACSKRSTVMKTWGCVQRIVQQSAMRVLVRRGRRESPYEMIDRRLLRERRMLTTLQTAKLLQTLGQQQSLESASDPGAACSVEELVVVEQILVEFYHDLRRVYRYYASIDVELQRTDHLLRQHHKPHGGVAGGGSSSSSSSSSSSLSPRDAQDEVRFFRKISTSMSLVEFHVFLKDCRVFGTARPFPYEFIERVFELVNVELAVPSHASSGLDADATGGSWSADHDSSEMTPAEFVEALVRIAASKYVRFRHTASSSSHSSSSSSSAPLSLSQRVRRLLVEIVLPNAMQEKERVNVFHEELLTPHCREILAKHHKPLLAVYARFAGVEGDHHSNVKSSSTHAKSSSSAMPRPRHAMLSVNGLVVLLKHFELLREHFLNLDDVQHIVSEVLQLEREGIQFDLSVVAECLATLESQDDDDRRDDNRRDARDPRDPRAHQGSTSVNDLLFLTFAEFLEVVAAVACHLRPDAFVPLADKLDDFFSEELLRTRSHKN